MGFLRDLFGIRSEPASPAKQNWFDSMAWLELREKFGLTVEPFPACPVDKKSGRDMMWATENALYFAPKQLQDVEQVEAYPIEQIKNFYINPKDHNEIRLNLNTGYQPMGSGVPLLFRSNSLEHFRKLLPGKEYTFSAKTMQLGNAPRTTSQKKIGDLRDVRSGGEFEEYLATMFEIFGYRVENDPTSQDQGIDLFISKDKVKYGIQAKFYVQSVGNAVIQKAIVGREFYKLDKGIVITNSKFTPAAKQLAERTGIRLIDGEELHKFARMAKSGKIGNLSL